MTLLIIVLGVAIASAMWLALVRVVFRLPDRPLALPVTTADGWTLTLWHRAPAQKRFVEPVVLCHGLGNNASFFEFRGARHLARVLADAGFEVFTMNCRGAGVFEAADDGFIEATVDDHLDLDVPAVFDAIEARTGQRTVTWVGHSLGGVIGLLASARGARGRLQALVTIGSPVFFEEGVASPALLRLGQRLAPAGRFPAEVFTAAIAPVAPLFPVPRLANIAARVNNIEVADQRFLLANVFAPLFRGVMAQLETWVVGPGLVSLKTGLDLRAPALAVRDVPTLVVGGSVDHLAPLAATNRLFDALTAVDKQRLLVGTDYGQATEYGHGDLVVGRDAPRDVYPPIVEFLQRRSTATEGVPKAEGSSA